MDLSQVGFAEFVGKLLSEVFDAVITSQVDQRRQAVQLIETARLAPEEVAPRVISEAQLEEELVYLFPSEDGGAPHDVYAGAPYSPAGPAGGEAPPFGSLLGVSL